METKASNFYGYSPQNPSACARDSTPNSGYGRAQGMFQKYLEIKPKAATETFQLGWCILTPAAVRTRSSSGRIIETTPDHPPALFYRALALAQENQIVPARQSLDVLLKSAPVDNLYFSRGKELLHNLDVPQHPHPPPRPWTRAQH